MKKISLIIPVYRNVESLEQTYKNSIKILGTFPQHDYEIIFVNDGSDDGSLQKLLELKQANSNKVKVVDFTRNFGQLAAVIAGMKLASGDAFITMSADLQEPVELIIQMIAKWDEGCKVVLGKRIGREDKLAAKLVSKLFYALIKQSVKNMPKGGFDIFLLDKVVYKELLQLDHKSSFLQGNILWFGYEPCFVEYRRLKREFGKSQWPLRKKITYSIDGIISTSYWPIRLMSLLGIMVSLLGFILALAVFINYFYGTPVKGYTPIVMILLIISGMIMTMLGVIGEYLWRIYEAIKGKPLFIVKNIY
jgi:dolichol-phosphate mannosyltransferase